MAESKTTFFSKNAINCPVCGTSFYREELLSGRGRLNADKLTMELRRLYKPTQKFGEVHPLIYPVTVCPSCYFAVFGKDFEKTPPEILSPLKGTTDMRKKTLNKLFSKLDYTKNRSLLEGTASYILALLCYDHFPADFCPAFKQGLSAIRAAWLCNSLHEKQPTENYDQLALVFYRKARFFYNIALEYESTGKQNLHNAGNMGPDTDQNYGFDGIMYLAGYLELHYGPSSDPEKRKEKLEKAKILVARLFGMGKKSKSKPSVILDMARDLHKEISDEVEGMNAL